MSIHTKHRDGRDTYVVIYVQPDGRQYKRGFRTRKEAEYCIVRERAARLNGTWIDPGRERCV